MSADDDAGVLLVRRTFTAAGTPVLVGTQLDAATAGALPNLDVALAAGWVAPLHETTRGSVPTGTGTDTEEGSDVDT